VTNIAKKVVNIMRSAFPDLLAAGRFSLGTQGNDDAPENYWFPFTANQSTNPWASNLAEVFTETGAFNLKEANNYSYGGAFSTEIGGLQIITINTIIYSVAHKPRKPMGDDPFGQFAWLKSQLKAAKARGRPAWIVGHIPPGLETYTLTELWEDTYVANYLALVQDAELGPFVAAQLFGHVHACEFRLLPKPANATGPILLSGALSPIYKNNPAFRVIEYDSETSRPLGMVVYSAVLSEGSAPLQWHLALNVTDAYEALKLGVSRDGFLSHESYVDLAKDLSKGGDSWNLYARWYKANYTNALWAYGCAPLAPTKPGEPSMAGVAQYMCATTVSVTEDHFVACVNQSVHQGCGDHEDDNEVDDDREAHDDSGDGSDTSKVGLAPGQILALSIWITGLVCFLLATAVYLKKRKTPLCGAHVGTEKVLDVVVAPFSPNAESVETLQVPSSLPSNLPMPSSTEDEDEEEEEEEEKGAGIQAGKTFEEAPTAAAAAAAADNAGMLWEIPSTLASLVVGDGRRNPASWLTAPEEDDGASRSGSDTSSSSAAWDTRSDTAIA